MKVVNYAVPQCTCIWSLEVVPSYGVFLSWNNKKCFYWFLDMFSTLQLRTKYLENDEVSLPESNVDGKSTLNELEVSIALIAIISLLSHVTIKFIYSRFVLKKDFHSWKRGILLIEQSVAQSAKQDTSVSCSIPLQNLVFASSNQWYNTVIT